MARTIVIELEDDTTVVLMNKTTDIVANTDFGALHAEALETLGWAGDGATIGEQMKQMLLELLNADQNSSPTEDVSERDDGSHPSN